MGLFNSVGLMWSPELVGWGARGKDGGGQELLGCYPFKLDANKGKGALSDDQRKRQTLNFWGNPGIYALYKGDALVYVGQATSLGTRLLAHYRSDHLVERWDSFSWVSPLDYVERPDPKKSVDIEAVALNGVPTAADLDAWLTEIEALTILLGKPADNRQRGVKFGNHTWGFEQVRSLHADKTQAEMIAELHHVLVLKKPL